MSSHNTTGSRGAPSYGSWLFLHEGSADSCGRAGQGLWTESAELEGRQQERGRKWTIWGSVHDAFALLANPRDTAGSSCDEPLSNLCDWRPSERLAVSFVGSLRASISSALQLPIRNGSDITTEDYCTGIVGAVQVALDTRVRIRTKANAASASPISCGREGRCGGQRRVGKTPPVLCGRPKAALIHDAGPAMLPSDGDGNACLHCDWTAGAQGRRRRDRLQRCVSAASMRSCGLGCNEEKVAESLVHRRMVRA